MEETQERTLPQPDSISEMVVATVLGVTLAVIPTWLIARNHSLEMGIGLGMVLIPLLGLIGWASGSAKALAATLGGILQVFVVATIGNATNSTLAQKLLLPKAEMDFDESLRQTLAVQERIASAETVEELDEVISHLQLRQRFVYRRRVVMIIAALMALVVTGICMLDWMSLRQKGGSFLLPSSFKETEFENLWLIFPVVFVLLAVPLAVCFANYAKRYFVGCLLLSVFVGLAFYFLFHANLPSLKLWIPPCIVYIVTSGVGLLADWVPLDHLSLNPPSESENPPASTANN